MEREVLQALHDIPLVEDPIEIICKNLRIEKEELLAIVEDLKARKIIRRIAPVLGHRKMGYDFNPMLLFKLEGDRLAAKACELSKYTFVSHLFRRDNPYGFNLYCMIHARTKEEMDEKIGRLVGDDEDVQYLIAISTKELKKESLSVL